MSLVGICHRCAPGQRVCPVDHKPLYIHAQEKFCPREYYTLTPEHLLRRPKPKTDCALRGDETRKVKCESCSGKTVMLKVFACPTHGECSLSPKAGVKYCGGCAERTTEARA